MDRLLIRDGRDDDAWHLIGLVSGCWSYVAPWARRQRLGRRLVGLVEEEAIRRGQARVELWTDATPGRCHSLPR